MATDIPEEKPINPEPEDSHSGEGDQKPPNTPPPIIAKTYVPPPEASHPHAKRKKDSGLDWARFVVEVLTLLALVWYACIASRQLTEMHNATVASTKSAKAAQSAADTAAKTLRSSEAAMVIDQRPWLKVFAGSPNPDRPEVTNIRITITINQPVSMPLTIRNIGKTAAQKILGYAIVEVVSMGKEPNIPDHQPPGFPQIDPPSAVPQKPTHAPTGFATSLIYPSDFFDFSIPRLRVGERQSVVSPISEREFESLRTGKSYFAVYGAVTYRDIFQVLHWTKFCKSIRADSVEMLPSQSVACANYTAVDNNTK